MLSGQPRLWLFAALLLASQVQAGTVYKCIKEDKVVFSQLPCPQAFKQHKIEYQYGVTTETAREKELIRCNPFWRTTACPKTSYCSDWKPKSIGCSRKTAIWKYCGPASYKSRSGNAIGRNWSGKTPLLLSNAAR